MVFLALFLVTGLLVVLLAKRGPVSSRFVDPITACAAVGGLAALAGAALILGADHLVTHWQALGNGAWSATTDPSDVATYRIIGGAVLTFGLVLDALAASRWVGIAARGPAGSTWRWGR